MRRNFFKIITLVFLLTFFLSACGDASGGGSGTGGGDSAITLSKSSCELMTGGEFELTASMKDYDGGFLFTTDNKNVAALKKLGDNKYLVTAGVVGTAKITVSVSGYVAVCTVTVVEASGGETFTLSMDNAMLRVGSSFNLEVAGLGSYTGSINWRADNTDILEMERINQSTYKVTALKKGTATVSAATINGKAECKVTVNRKANADEALGLSDKSLVMKTGSSTRLFVDAQFSNSVEWKSSAPTVAAVDKDGVISAGAEGDVVITATANGKSQTCAVSVSVSPVASLSGSNGTNSLYSEFVNWYGRTAPLGSAVEFDNVAAGFETTFYGTKLTAKLTGRQGSYLSVFVDGEDDSGKFIIKNLTSETDVTLAENLEQGFHTVKVLHRGEPQTSGASLVSLTTDGWLSTAPDKPERKIEVYGDSISAGYANMAASTEAKGNVNSNGLYTYAYLAAANLDAQINVIAYSGWGMFTTRWNNYLVPDVYSYVTAYNKTAWDFSSYQADVVIINLGTNDIGNAGGGNPNMPVFTAENYKNAYKNFATALRGKYPNAHILCVYDMMDKSEIIKTAIRDMIAERKTAGDSNLSFFSLTSSDNSAPGGHPSTSGHLSASKTLTAHLKELMSW